MTCIKTLLQDYASSWRKKNCQILTYLTHIMIEWNPLKSRTLFAMLPRTQHQRRRRFAQHHRVPIRLYNPAQQTLLGLASNDQSFNSFEDNAIFLFLVKAQETY